MTSIYRKFGMRFAAVLATLAFGLVAFILSAQFSLAADDTVDSVVYEDDDEDGTVDQIVITFEETITECTWDAEEWEIITPGSIGISALGTGTCDGASITIPVTATANVTGGAVNPVIKYTNNEDNLEDGGEISTQEFEAEDAAAPVVLDIIPTGANAFIPAAVSYNRSLPIRIIFSEPMDKTQDFEHGEEFTMAPNPGGWSVSWNAEGTQVTLTHATLSCGDQYEFSIDTAKIIADAGSPDTLLAGGPYFAGNPDGLLKATCSGGGGSAPVIEKKVTVTSPNGGQTWEAGSMHQITWNTEGAVSYVNIWWSGDNGVSYQQIAQNVTNSGSYNWMLPNAPVGQALVKVEATDLAQVLALDVSDASFSIIEEDSAPTVDEPETRPSEDNISEVTTGTYIKGAGSTAVYYIDASFVRHPFLDSQTFYTWQESFANVKTVTDETLATLDLGAPMLPKHGVVLVKVQSISKVYWLDENGPFAPVLRHIETEAIAKTLFGNNWADYVIDVPVTAFHLFNQGNSISSAGQIAPELSKMRTRTWLNSR